MRMHYTHNYNTSRKTITICHNPAAHCAHKLNELCYLYYAAYVQSHTYLGKSTTPPDDTAWSYHIYCSVTTDGEVEMQAKQHWECGTEAGTAAAASAQVGGSAAHLCYTSMSGGLSEWSRWRLCVRRHGARSKATAEAIEQCVCRKRLKRIQMWYPLTVGCGIRG